MRRKAPESLSIFLLLTLLLLAFPQKLQACGPFSLEAIFVFSKHPDVPLDRFARGELGVLQPSYARSYLVAAYRHLSGSGLNPQEQKALLDLWKERLDYSWNNPTEDTVATWTAARGRVITGGEAPKIEVYRSREKPNEYEAYLNCQEDAFRTAAATLEERIKKYGAGSPLLKDWVGAQDEVFANCSEGQHIPAKPGADADALLRADRNYQIAAALFYSSQFDDARHAFEEIAAEQSSPWRQKATYLIARTLVRQASFSAEPKNAEALTQAETQLNKILSDKSLAELHPASGRLLSLVRLRLHPNERLRELAHELLRKNSQDTIKQNLWDYTILLDKFEGEDVDEDTAKKFKDLSSGIKEDDLTDWVLTFEADEKDALDHAVQKWEQTSAQPWLAAAISKISADHPKAANLLAAGAKVKADSPAFAEIVFHSVRLMLEAGRADDARAQLDALLGQRQASFPPSASNLLLGLRMKLARDANEFFKFAQRTPSALSWDDDGREIPANSKELEAGMREYENRAMFDTDAIRIINEALPLAVLKDAASNKILPPHLRRDLAVAAWVRTVLYNEREMGREIAPVLESLAPELKGYLDDEVSAPTRAARKFSALYAILKFPGMQPFVDRGIARQTPLKEMDSYRNNWWCSLQSETHPESESEDEKTAGENGSSKTKPVASPVADFLDEAQRTAAAREQAQLAALGTAPNYFCRLAVEWANQSPDDPRVPEALHLAVKSTRYGCADDETGPLSKAAFQILHKKYPNSPWAKKTPYWFSNKS